MSADGRKYPGWVWWPAALRQQCPDGLDYEPVSGQAIIWRDRKDSNLSFRLTAERTTAVLLTQKRQSPDVSARALFILHAAT